MKACAELLLIIDVSGAETAVALACSMLQTKPAAKAIKRSSDNETGLGIEKVPRQTGNLPMESFISVSISTICWQAGQEKFICTRLVHKNEPTQLEFGTSNLSYYGKQGRRNLPGTAVT